MSRILGWVSGISLALLIAIIAMRAGHLPGRNAVRMELAGGLPAILYSPGELLATSPWIIAKLDEPLPAVVLIHGYSGDQLQMASMAASLTDYGYLVLTIDLPGHGANTGSYRAGWGLKDHLLGDVVTAVRFLKDSSIADPTKIIVAGHSRGAMAALTYGSHFTDVAGLVLIAGSWELLGPERPRNVLFVHAEKELPNILESAASLSATLAGVEATASGETYGAMAAGTAVRRVQVPGTNHGSILASPVALGEIVGWMNDITGQTTRSAEISFRSQPPLGAFAFLLFLLVLPGIGLALARLAPQVTVSIGPASVLDLPMLALALAAALALNAVPPPGFLLGLTDADANISCLTLAGISLTVALALRHRVPLPQDIARSLAWGIAAVIVLYALLRPLAVTLHGLGLTPEKALLVVLATLLLLPLAYSVQTLLLRNSLLKSATLRILARGLILASFAAGNALGVFGTEGTIAFGMCLIAFLYVEIVLAGFYQRSRNVLAGATVEALTVAWLVVVMLPSNFR